MNQVLVCLRYLLRGRVNALLHLQPAAAVGWALFLVPVGWLAYAALALLQEYAGLAPAYRYELTAALFAATFSLLGFAALLGMTSAQGFNTARLQFLPLRAGQVYALELLDKLVVLAPLLGLLAAPALRVTMLLGYDALAYARLAGVLALFVLLAVEALTLSLVLLQGGLGATRGIWRLLYTVAFLGGYVALVKVRAADAWPLLQARWSPWAVAARAVLDGSVADAGLLAGLTAVLFPAGLLVYRWAYLRERPGAGVGRLGLDGSGLLVALGRPLGWLNRGAGRILTVDLRQVFRDPASYSLFLFAAAFLVALDAAGVTRRPDLQFYVPFLLAVNVPLRLGLNCIGRDGTAFKLLRLLPISTDQLLCAKIALALILTGLFGATASILWLWGDWPALAGNLVAFAAWAVFVSTLAVYLGILYPTYGNRVAGLASRYPFLLGAAALPALVYPLDGALRVLVLVAGSLAGAGVCYGLARRQLGRWAVEQMGDA